MKNVQVKLFARWKDELAVIGFHLWLKLHKVNDCLFNTLPGACAARECSHNPSGCWEAVDHSSNVFLPRGPTLVTWRGLRGVRDRTELSAFYSNRRRTNTNIVILYLFWLASVTHLLISWTSCMNLRWDWLLWELRLDGRDVHVGGRDSIYYLSFSNCANTDFLSLYMSQLWPSR